MEAKFKQIYHENGIKTTYNNEPHSPWQNRAKPSIQDLKYHVNCKMKTRNIPLRLWVLCCNGHVLSRYISSLAKLIFQSLNGIVMQRTFQNLRDT
jgi:hypothetical protein